MATVQQRSFKGVPKISRFTGLWLTAAMVTLMTWNSNSSATPGLQDQRLAPCPNRPNCVSSDAAPGTEHYIEAFLLQITPEEAWAALRELLTEQARVHIVSADDSYLHAEARTRWLGFVDDMEFHLRPERGQIAVRSASRLGYSDLGVNRKRVEALRRQLQTQGVLRQ